MRRLGIETVKDRGPESRGQKIAYISQVDYELLRSELAKSRKPVIRDNNLATAYGVFYLIQLEPEYDSGRFKLGFAVNIDERIRTHRTAAPLCRLVKTWPCKQLWERTAIDSVSQGCERLHVEVIRTDDIGQIEDRCDKFFQLMPMLGSDDKVERL